MILASLTLAACGSSSSTAASTAAQSSGAGAAGATGPQGAGGARFSALRSCLAKNGINLPQRPAGQRRPRTGGGAPPAGLPGGGLPGAGGPGGGPRLPAGVTRQQYQAALQKCGGGAGFGRRRLTSPAYRQALTKFAVCMRQNGINLAAPNTSGNGPVFNSKGLNTTSAAFKTAYAKCQSNLPGSFGARAGASGAPPGAGGAPAQ